MASSLNLRNAEEDAFGGIAGAFQKAAKPCPITFVGSSETGFLPQLIAAAALSIQSCKPLGFILAP